eukprot:scaffold28755_cov105-Isochrysis_galbana.AAC.1
MQSVPAAAAARGSLASGVKGSVSAGLAVAFGTARRGRCGAVVEEGEQDGSVRDALRVGRAGRALKEAEAGDCAPHEDVAAWRRGGGGESAPRTRVTEGGVLGREGGAWCGGDLYVHWVSAFESTLVAPRDGRARGSGGGYRSHRHHTHAPRSPFRATAIAVALVKASPVKRNLPPPPLPSPSKGGAGPARSVRTC